MMMSVQKRMILEGYLIRLAVLTTVQKHDTFLLKVHVCSKNQLWGASGFTAGTLSLVQPTSHNTCSLSCRHTVLCMVLIRAPIKENNRTIHGVLPVVTRVGRTIHFIVKAALDVAFSTTLGKKWTNWNPSICVSPSTSQNIIVKVLCCRRLGGHVRPR